MRTLVALLAMTHVQLLSPSARGASFVVVESKTGNNTNNLTFEPNCNVKLFGEIRAGDAETAREKLGKIDIQAGHAESQSPWSGTRIPALCLFSTGGDLATALDLAEVFNGWMMVVPDGWVCQSACAVLFMSAKAGFPGRFLHVNGTLDFHRPELVFPEGTGKTVPIQQAQDAYAQALASLRRVIYPERLRLGSADPVAAVRRLAQLEELLDSGMINIGEVHPKEHPNFAVGRGADSGFVPLDLMFMFLSSSDYYRIETIKQAMLWGIDVYGASITHVSRKHLVTGCVNIAALACHNDKPCWVPGTRFPPETVARVGKQLLADAVDVLRALPESRREVEELMQEDSDSAKRAMEHITKLLRNSLSLATSDMPPDEVENYIATMIGEGGPIGVDAKFIWNSQRATGTAASRVQVFEFFLQDKMFRDPKTNLLDNKCEVRGVMTGGNLTRLRIRTFNDRGERTLRPWMTMPFSVRLDALVPGTPQDDPGVAAVKDWLPTATSIF